MPSTTEGQVKFVQYHQPALESGEYQIKVEQTINDTGGKFNETYTKKLTFAVIGERFGSLAPQDIYSVFPPPESLGEHSNVLPHITIKRSTLPWERYPGTEDKNLPWLVLLLFQDSDFAHKDDKPKLKNMLLKDLLAGEAGIKFPEDMELDGVGQTGDELVSVFDIKKKYLKDILPTKEDLAYISHVRQAEQVYSPRILASGDRNKNEYSTIICNRLPEPNGTSTVHLVSIEGRFGSDGNFDFQQAGDEEKIRFVSLAGWSFSCIDPEQTFTELLKKLNRTPNSPRLPVHENQQAETALAMGYLPLPHDLRQGSKTVSWYRSPLATGFNSETYEFPVQAADELLRYDSELGLFDTSYAAAWQLGRMLTLQNKSVAVELFNWKRANAQKLIQLEHSLIDLPFSSTQNAAPLNVPQSVYDWFKGLELLQGVPFNYLVPDEQLVPAESIRFFWLDSLWVDCLQDGAFSIGRVTKTSVEEDSQIRANAGRSLPRSVDQKITGIIVRSQVVSGWPGLLVDGYDRVVADTDSIESTEANPLPLIRMEKLAKDVLTRLGRLASSNATETT